MPETVFTMTDLTSYLAVGAMLFGLGVIGFISRRNLIVMFLSAELMLQGVGLSLVGFGRFHGNWNGQIMTIFILTIAACEAAISLALIVQLFNRAKSLDVSVWQAIREPGLPVTVESELEAEPLLGEPGPESYPHLTPAGIEPEISLVASGQRAD
ncbi:MAG: NADH-quinone oxidoreductase subunit NuoK [bacterium]